jgi:large subunit ribosomal protein L9
MKVVFLQNVEGSGHTGEIKEVADGFARNFLLPRRMAAPATPDAIKRAEARAALEARRQAELDEQARAMAEKMAPPVVISARVGEQGRLYGSITAGDIAEAVSKLVGEEIDRHLMMLEEPIKALGTYEIPFRLTRNVEAAVTVEVVAEEVAAEEEEKKPARAKKKAAAKSEEEAPAAETVEVVGEEVAAEEEKKPARAKKKKAAAKSEEEPPASASTAEAEEEEPEEQEPQEGEKS